MRTKPVFLVMMGVLLCLGSGSLHAAADPGGFLGLKWTQSVGDCKKQGICSSELIAVQDQINGETIHRGTPKTLSGIPLTFSSFAFHGNRFYLGTAVFAPRGSNYDDLKNLLVKDLGKPRMANATYASWWVGNTKVTLHKGESLCGLVYAHAPTFAAVSKIKRYPAPAAATPPAPKKQ